MGSQYFVKKDKALLAASQWPVEYELCHGISLASAVFLTFSAGQSRSTMGMGGARGWFLIGPERSAGPLSTYYISSAGTLPTTGSWRGYTPSNRAGISSDQIGYRPFSSCAVA